MSSDAFVTHDDDGRPVQAVLTPAGCRLHVGLVERGIRARRVDDSVMPGPREVALVSRLRQVAAGCEPTTEAGVAGCVGATTEASGSLDGPVFAHDLLDVGEAAEVIGCSESNVRKQMAAKALRTVSVGKSTKLLDRVDVERYAATAKTRQPA